MAQTTSVRGVLSLLGIAFAVYMAVRGLLWVGEAVIHPIVLVGTVVVFTAVAVACILYGLSDAKGVDADQEQWLTETHGPIARLSPVLTAVAVVLAAAMPSAVALAVPADARAAAYATWYIGALGLLMTVLMVRRRPWAAWLGTAALAAGSIAWLGVLPAMGLGLVGSVMWVLVAQMAVLSLDRAARDTARLSRLQRTATAWRAGQQGARRERRLQVRRALAVAGPILSRAIERAGVLTADERAEAHIAEGQLRDEMRAARLLDDRVRAELDAARRRGGVVSVVDEGGLEDLTLDQLGEIRAELATALHDAASDRLYVRASSDPAVVVTVVGRSASPSTPSAGSAPSDEDSVDVWHEIARPGRPDADSDTDAAE